MKKRRYGWNVLTLLLVLSLVFLAACGSGNSSGSSAGGDNNGSANGGQETQGTDGAQANPADDRKWKLTYSIIFGPPTNDVEPKYWATERFRELVHEKTNGRVEIEIFYSNQLVPANELLDGVANGTVDMGGGTASYGTIVPTNDVAWLPFSTRGVDHFFHVMDETEIGDIFKQDMEDYGAKVLFFWPHGTNIFISKQPIAKVEDLKGKKIYASSGLWSEWFNSLGAARVNLSPTEQYEAMLRGTIDATTYPPNSIRSYKFAEVADYYTTPGNKDPNWSFTFISKAKWDEFPEDIQNAIMEAAAETQAIAGESAKDADVEGLKYADENGMTRVSLTDEEYDRFVDSAQVAWDAFASINDKTARMVELLKADIEDWKANNPKDKEWIETYFGN